MQQNTQTTPQPTYIEEDEIDLFELWQGLVEEKKAIFITAFTTVALAAAYAFFGGKTFETTSAYQAPLAKDVTDLNFPGGFSMKPDQAYKTFQNNLLQPDLIKESYQNNPKIQQLFDNDVSADDAIQTLQKLITIKLPDLEKKKNKKEPQIFTQVSTQWKTAEESLLINKQLISEATQQTKAQIFADFKKQLQHRLKMNQTAFDLENKRVNRELQAEIKRLTEEDDEKRRKINERIQLLRDKAKQDRQFRIERLQTDLAIAKRLGIKTPLDPLDYKKSKNQSKLKIDFTKRYPSGYWMGATVLAEEIDRLQNRTTDDPFITELPELFKQLEDLKVNERIQTILARKDNLPFSDKLRQLVNERKMLNKALQALNTADFKVVQTVQSPLLPSKPIKPKKALILAVAAVLGLMLGIFIALIRHAAKNRKQKEA